MKKVFVILLCFGVSFSLKAQSYPAEWKEYTTSGYLFDIQSDTNVLGISETSFKNNLLNAARANIAKQVIVSVKDESKLKIHVKNGRSQTEYDQSSESSTSLDMALVETRVLYNSATKQGYAIAFINKASARRHYINQMEFIVKSMNNSLFISRNYINNNFKDKAKEEIASGLALVERTRKPLFWLNVFDMSESDLKLWNDKTKTLELQLKRLLSDLNRKVQQERKAKFRSFLANIHHMLDISYICSKHHMVGVNYIAAYEFNEYLMVGAGTGISLVCKDYYGDAGKEWPLNRINVPLYAYAKSNFIEFYDFSLFFDLAFGGRFSTPSSFGYSTCGMLLNPRFGFNYQISSNSSCYFAIGYQGQTLPCLKKIGNNSITFEHKLRSAIDFHVGFTF